LRNERRRAATDTHKPVSLVAEQLHGVAATELEVDDGVGRGQRQLVSAIGPGGVGAVTTVDDIPA
jgi:hypothetical protein